MKPEEKVSDAFKANTYVQPEYSSNSFRLRFYIDELKTKSPTEIKEQLLKLKDEAIYELKSFQYCLNQINELLEK